MKFSFGLKGPFPFISGKKTPKSSIKNKNKHGNKDNKDDKDGKSENETEKKPLKLPEAHYVEIPDYDIPDAPPQPNSYFRFIGMKFTFLC